MEKSKELVIIKSGIFKKIQAFFARLFNNNRKKSINYEEINIKNEDAFSDLKIYKEDEDKQIGRASCRERV